MAIVNSRSSFALCSMVLCCAAAVLAMTSCAADSTGDRPQLMVLAAASTVEPMERLCEQFADEHGVDVRFSAGPSNGLAQQVISGAPADLYLAANNEWADRVAAEGIVRERVDLVTNRIVLIVPAGNPASVHEPADLMNDHVQHIAIAGENVPAGVYAEQVLASFDLWEPLVESSRIVRGHDVRVALNYVVQREADAGLVYETDTRAIDSIETVHRGDPSRHQPIVYPLIRLTDDPHAIALFDFLQSDAAAEMFREYGFTPLGSVDSKSDNDDPHREARP